MSEWALPARILCNCGGDTKVVNTRGREDAQTIYRQRRCDACGEVFATFESRVPPEVRAERLDTARTNLIEAVDQAIELLQDAGIIHQ